MTTKINIVVIKKLICGEKITPRKYQRKEKRDVGNSQPDKLSE